MSRVFKRPMFRKGGGANMNGIMSNVQDRENYENGTELTPRQRYEQIVNQYSSPAIDPLGRYLIEGSLKGFGETGGTTLQNLSKAFGGETLQRFFDTQDRQRMSERDMALAGLEMDLKEEDRLRRLQEAKEATKQQQEFQKQLLSDKQAFQKTESEKDRDLRRFIERSKDDDAPSVKSARIILGKNATAEQIGQLASELEKEARFGVRDRADKSIKMKIEQSINENFGLQAGPLKNYYDFTTSGRANELSQQTGKTFMGPIKPKMKRGEITYKTKNKAGLYFDPINNVAIEVNPDGTFNRL
jgi:hypothetical protein